jgi:hypothetical protein
MDLDDIRNAQFDDDERRKYHEFIKQVANPSERKRNERLMMKDLLLENLFQLRYLVLFLLSVVYFYS